MRVLLLLCLLSACGGGDPEEREEQLACVTYSIEGSDVPGKICR